MIISTSSVGDRGSLSVGVEQDFRRVLGSCSRFKHMRAFLFDRIPRANSFVQASAQDPAFVCLHGNHPDAWGMGGWKRKKMNKEEQQKRQPTIERQRE